MSVAPYNCVSMICLATKMWYRTSCNCKCISYNVRSLNLPPYKYLISHLDLSTMHVSQDLIQVHFCEIPSLTQPHFRDNCAIASYSISMHACSITATPVFTCYVVTVLLELLLAMGMLHLCACLQHVLGF